MTIRTLQLFAPLFLLCLSACGARLSTMSIQGHVQQSLVAEQESAPVATQVVSGGIDVVLERQPLMFRNGNDIEGDLTWTSVIPPADENLDAWLASLRERFGTSSVVLVSDYSESLATALDHHLRQRFAAARVSIVEPNAERANRPTIVASHIQIRDDGIKRFELALQDADGSVVSAQGERRPRRHLAWIVPISVLLGPIGAIVGSNAGRAVRRAAFMRAFGEAVDELARAYVEHLVACRTGAAECPALAAGARGVAAQANF